jgi:hypothetical protein
VEVTGVGGGVRTGTAEFAKVLEYGCKELKDAMTDGRIHLIDVQDLWTRGVSNPELEQLPPDILAKWSISETGTGAGGGGAGGGGQPQNLGNSGGGGGGGDPAPVNPGPGPGPGPAPGPAPSSDSLAAYVGDWTGTATEILQNGQRISYELDFSISIAAEGWLGIMAEAEAALPTDWGVITVAMQQALAGQMQNGMIQMAGQWKRMSYVDTGQVMDAPPDVGFFRLQGNTLVGRYGNSQAGAAGWADFTMTRDN